jgi:hypothetical protein
MTLQYNIFKRKILILRNSLCISRLLHVSVHLFEEFESIRLCKFMLGDVGPTPGRKFKVLMLYS